MRVLFLLASLLMVSSAHGAQNSQNETVMKIIVGRVSIDDGSRVPTVDTFRGPNILFGLQASVPGSASRIADATSQSDGSFELPLIMSGGMGEVSIDVTRLPLGYYVKSIHYGSTDLLHSSLLLMPTAASTIQVVLTTTPPVGTPQFNVEGRIRNWVAGAASSMTISLQSQLQRPDGASPLQVGITQVKANGTFEIRGVPPGHYRSVSPSNAAGLIAFDVVDRDVSGLEFALPAGTPSVVVTNGPFGMSGNVRGSALQVNGPTAPLDPPAGKAMVSVSQSGQYGRKMYEGAISLFRIEQSGLPVEEKRLESTALAFTINPGTYQLRGYLRACDGNCGRLGAPESVCTVPIKVSAGEVLYAERVLQNETCSFRFNPAPVK